MRSFVVAALLLTTSIARAEEVAEPKMAIGASATVWLPSGDADDFVNESLGARPFFTYRALSFLAVVATFDWIFVNEKDNVGSITYYAVSAGARFIKSRPGQVEPYGEFLLGWHHLDGQNVDDSNLGFRIGGGATYPLGKLVAQGGLSYSAVSIDSGFFDVDIDALVIEIGLAGRF